MDPFWNAFHRHDGRQAEAARIQQEDDDYELAIQMATSGDNNLLDDGGDGADDPMARDAADRANWTVCVACNDHGQNFVPECRHPYCGDCLGHVFTQAMNDENLFPPRCCQREIALQDARPMLKGELATQFEAKAVEYRTLDRTYCSNMQCGAFIPPDPTTSGLFGIRYARCLQCSQFTCKGCKNVYHYGPCAVDIGLEQLRATAQGEVACVAMSSATSAEGTGCRRPAVAHSGTKSASSSAQKYSSIASKEWVLVSQFGIVAESDRWPGSYSTLLIARTP
ncbi:hypothetical protein B0A48_02414 [Cryoendolithus antarcticus]|uniref:IBR domain-containing protein n=1 Tax=Cryoendolithus antarcticus TaxID=1507870 RepID=A0A1V8TNK3_9PEZI|nr:hypothetical protein B0A48_02414 [Cryoendolithus antarcticus]